MSMYSKYSKEMPMTIVKQDPTEEELKEWISSAAGFLEGLTSNNENEPLKLYDYQLAHLFNKERFRAINKSRQTGFSFVFAGEGLAKSHLKYNHTSIFVSYNMDEAKEKIRYAKLLYDTLPLKFKRNLIVDNKHSLEFEDSTGRKRTRLISHPQRPPRGKGGHVDVYLDEFAHYQWMQQIYDAAIPVISRGGGVLTVGSTPLGKGDPFHQIIVNKSQYQDFTRQWIFWWDCPEFCKNTAEARKSAPYMGTHERVMEFGTPILKSIFRSMLLESFQQEYECKFVDESTAFFPYDLIYDNVPQQQNYKNRVKLANSIEGMLQMINSGEITGTLYGGYDVGRHKDLSEMIIIEHRKNSHQFIFRMNKHLKKAKFKKQKRTIRKTLKMLPIEMFGIDQNGLGMNLSEDMEDEFPFIVEPVSFTNQTKEEMANRVKIIFQNQKYQLPLDRELIAQIHSIKKKITQNKYAKFDTDENNNHHGDKFWALALASYIVDDDNFFREDISASDDIDIDKAAGIKHDEMLDEKSLSEIADSIQDLEDWGGKNVQDGMDFDII